MNVRKIREDLGRARACLKRNEMPRALYLIVTAFKETGSNPPMDLRGDFRETITALAKDEDFRREHPGKEVPAEAFDIRMDEIIAQ